jgi:hypothetical protein
MNVFPKFGFSVALRLAILCCGMLFGAASVQAQDASPFVSATWLSGPEATTVLSGEIAAIDQMLITAPPPNAVPNKMQLELYNGILNSIQDGMAVNEAAQMNFYKLAPSAHTDVAPTPDMNNQTWQDILDVMIALLTI